jgi:thiol-disulfide isomerase/thioredoxin
MPVLRRWLSRGLDALAILLVLYALFHFFVQPRLIPEAAVPAPPLALASLEGGRFSLAEHRGQVVFLDFWASWCEPCKESLPLVERYARTHPGADVVAVDVGETAGTARTFARAHRLANVILDPDEIAAHAFGVSGFPTMVVIDPAGMVRAKWIGFNPAIEQAMADARERYGKAPRSADGAGWTPAEAEAATARARGR